MKSTILQLALNETIHALRYVEAAANHLVVDADEVEAGKPAAIGVAYVKNRLSDAHDSLFAAEGEIRRLLQETVCE